MRNVLAGEPPAAAANGHDGIVAERAAYAHDKRVDAACGEVAETGLRRERGAGDDRAAVAGEDVEDRALARRQPLHAATLATAGDRAGSAV
jgi:hypothetical protein